MTTMPESIDNIPPVEIKDLPEEARRALEALRAGKAEDTVCDLKSELTLDQKRRRVTIGKICAIMLLLFGIGLGGTTAATQAFGTGMGVIALFLFVALLVWFLFVKEWEAQVENPWHEAMICTPNHLLAITMGLIRVFHLAEWESITVINRTGRYYIRLESASRRVDLGNVGDTGKEVVERFCNRLLRNIREASAGSRPA